MFRGVGVAGGSFGDDSTHALPGVYGTDGPFYDVDGQQRTSIAGLQFLRTQGIQFVRIDFRWERLQPALNAPFDVAERKRLQAMFAACKQADIFFIADCHNYGHRKPLNTTGLPEWGGPHIGDPAVPLSAWQDFWHRFIQAFGSNDHLLGYELMNEPTNIPGTTAQQVAASHAADQAAVDAIRQLDTWRYIFVDGYGFASVTNWSVNGAPWIDDQDRMDANGEPLLRYTAHHYFDVNHSSDYSTTPDADLAAIARIRSELKVFTDWLVANNVRGTITECGWPDLPGWNAAANVWFDDCDAALVGVFLWAAGAAWSPTYPLLAFTAGTSGDTDRQDWLGGDTIRDVKNQGRVLLDHLTGSPTDPPEPAGTGFLMSRGPTGSRWGLDAQGPDGGLPAMVTPTYGTTSGTSFTPFAQAADFAWYWGVSYHPQFFDAAQQAQTITLLQELNIAHVRAGIAYSPSFWHVYIEQEQAQKWYIACLNANEARSPGTAALWNVFNAPEERGYYRSPEAAAAGFQQAKYEYWVDTQDTSGFSIFRVMDGPAGSIAAGTNTWGGYFYNRDGTLTGSSGLTWDGVGLISGPNEPGHRNPKNLTGTRSTGTHPADNGWCWATRYTVSNSGIRWLARRIKAYRDHVNNRDKVVGATAEYIDYNTGRLVSGPAKLSQVPITPVQHITPESDWQTNTGTDPTGDFTDRVDGDFMDIHSYWAGHQILWDYMYGCPSSAYPMQSSLGIYGQNFGVSSGSQGTRHSVNGSLNPATPGVKFQRSVPITVSEAGETDKIGTDAFALPPDISGQYQITQGLVHYLQGAKRFEIYSLYDEGNGYGLLQNDFTRKAKFYALKNLITLVGYVQGPDEGVQPIQIPHTYTPVGLVHAGITAYPGQYAEVKPPTTTGSWFSRDYCMKLVLRRSADEFLVLLTRPFNMWARDDYFNDRVTSPATYYPGNPLHPTLNTIAHTQRYRRYVPDEGGVSNAVLHLPTGSTWTCHVAEPAKSSLTPSAASPITGNPTNVVSMDGCTYANMNDGQAYSPINDGTQMQITQSGNQLTVPMGGLTRVVRVVRSATAPPASPDLPIVVPSVGTTPASLRVGSVIGSRLHLKAVNVWGLPDDITNNVSISGTAFHQHQYAARATVCDTIRDWGGNCIRLRAQASDYNGAPSANTDSITKSQILDRIQNWLSACVANGNLYLVVCPWDGLDGPYAGSNFPAQYTNTFQFYTDVYARLGADPMVMYETPNEPNNISMAQWQTVMQGYLTHFRDTLGYTGVLVLDPPNWSNSGGSTSSAGNPAGYSDTTYSALEAFDAAKTAMNGKHQLVFAKHDYSNNSGYPGNVFSQTNWVNGMGGADIKHLIWANEFGNYNAGGPDPDTNIQWSTDYSVAARNRFGSKTNFVGAAPFLFGPWSDANRITDADNVTATAPATGWGTIARDYYFGSLTPPPTSLFTPGTVSNGSTSFDAGAANGAVSLGSKIARVEVNIGDNPTTFDDDVTYYADRGIKILLLFAIGSPTIIDATAAANAGAWATRFGPGGTFWSAYGGTDRPITHMEFGNETNFNYQQPPGENDGTAPYIAKAGLYAQRFQTAYNAVQAANPAVGLLCQATPNDSGTASWVNGMFSAVPSLAAMVSGWTLHPYTPDWLARINTAVSHLSSRDPGKPLDITEIGIATDNGRAMGDNYNWAVDLTYSQAATALSGVITGMSSQSWWPRVRHWMYYQAHDNAASGAGTPPLNKESYFGALQSNLAEKGAYSTQVRTIMAMTS